jgi:dTDP-4-amino-4,6-dideoxygalactose transaminase
MLLERGIPSMVYYPIELHKQKAFSQFWDRIERFPVSEQLVSTVLSLPMHTELTYDMVRYICENLIDVLDSINE